jgi:hypothetical protein
MIGRARLSLEPLEARETPAATGRVILDCEGFLALSRANGDADQPIVLGSVPNAPNSNETITIDANRTESVSTTIVLLQDGSVRPLRNAT